MKTILEVGNRSKNIPTKVQKPFRKEKKRRHTMWYHTLGTVYICTLWLYLLLQAGRRCLLCCSCPAVAPPALPGTPCIIQFSFYTVGGVTKNVFFYWKVTTYSLLPVVFRIRPDSDLYNFWYQRLEKIFKERSLIFYNF